MSDFDRMVLTEAMKRRRRRDGVEMLELDLDRSSSIPRVEIERALRGDTSDDGVNEFGTLPPRAGRRDELLRRRILVGEDVPEFVIPNSEGSVIPTEALLRAVGGSDSAQQEKGWGGVPRGGWGKLGIDLVKSVMGENAPEIRRGGDEASRPGFMPGETFGIPDDRSMGSLPPRLLSRDAPQEGGGDSSAGAIRPRRAPELERRPVSVGDAPISDSLSRTRERRDVNGGTVRELELHRETGPYQDWSGDGSTVNPQARALTPRPELTRAASLEDALLGRNETGARTLSPRSAPRDAPTASALLSRSLPAELSTPPSAVPRSEGKPLVDMARPPQFGFDLKGKPVRAWRGSDLETDLEYQRHLQSYKPKDRNGRVKSILYGIAVGLSSLGGRGDVNPWAALGAAVTGGLVGGFHPQFDEKRTHEYELAAVDARIEKHTKRRREEQQYEKGVADYHKTVAEIEKIKDEPERQRREAEFRSLDTMRRTLAGFYNDLDEFDPETDKDLATAMREVGLPVTAKRGAQEHKVVQDEKSGAWSVVTVNKRTGESVSRPVRGEGGAQLVTTPKGTLTAEEKEKDREEKAKDRASRERVAGNAEAGRNRRSQQGGAGISPARRASLQLQAEKLDARAIAEDKRQRYIHGDRYRAEARAIRQQLAGGAGEGGASGQFTADEVRARARQKGIDPEEAVRAAREAKLIKE